MVSDTFWILFHLDESGKKTEATNIRNAKNPIDPIIFACKVGFPAKSIDLSFIYNNHTNSQSLFHLKLLADKLTVFLGC